MHNRPKRRSRAIILLAVPVALAFAAGIMVDRIALAQQQPSITRTVLLTTDDPAGANYEAVMAVAQIPPGASAGKHRHPGIEIGYVLEGSVLFEHEGRANVTLKAGDSFKNDAAHDARNLGTTPAKILAVYLVEKGKPLAEPVR